MTNKTKPDPNVIIESLGGTFAVAKLCEVKPPSVCGWRKNGIPKSRLLYLKAIRPDVFEQHANKEAA